MSQTTKALSQVSLKSQLGSPDQLARQNREQHERIAALQAQRDEALKARHDARLARDRHAGQLVALRMELDALKEEAAEQRRQLAAASALFWQDRATMANFEAENRNLRHIVASVRREIDRIGRLAGAALVRGELRSLVERLR